MKKAIILIFVLFVLIIPNINVHATDDNQIQVQKVSFPIKMNGLMVNMPMFEFDERVYVPIIQLFDTIGLYITWNENEQAFGWYFYEPNLGTGESKLEISADNEANQDTLYEVIEGENTNSKFLAQRVFFPIKARGTYSMLDEMARYEFGGKVYIPLREFCEELGIDVKWNENEQLIEISTYEDPATITEGGKVIGYGKHNPDVIEVSIIDLIENSEKYAGKLVMVKGRLYCDSEMSAIFDSDGSLWLGASGISPPIKQLIELFNLKYVIVEGIFNPENEGGWGVYYGAIEKINRIELLEK